MSFHQIRSEEQFEALGDEFQRLDAAYSLLSGYGITFEMFLEKPWYYRNLTELLHDASGFRPLLMRQRAAALRADKELLRSELRLRLHNGAIFEPLHHYRYRRGGQMHFTRRERS